MTDAEETPSRYPAPINGGGLLPFTPDNRPSVFIDERAKAHILDGHANPSSDKSQFPPEWRDDHERIWTAVDAVLRVPGSIMWTLDYLNFYGTAGRCRIVVQIKRSDSGRVYTAFPVDGPGVTRRGRPLRLPANAYLEVRW